MKKIILPIALTVIASTLALSAADWPHWLGPNGDNTAPADSFKPDLSKWTTAWKASVGRGYSSVAVAAGRAYTLGHDEKAQETIFCFDAASGALRWKHAYEAKLMPTMHPGGPNATPTIAGNRVYTVSKDGQALCLSADDGRVVWHVNLVEAMGVKTPNWGFASSPVISGNQIIYSAGKVAALDLATGKILWTTKNDYLAGYTTAVVFDSGGKKFVAALDGKGLSILSATDGNEIARHPFSSMFDMTATTPFVLSQGKRIFISGNQSSDMLAFDGQKLSPAWTSKEIRNTMNNSVIMGKVLYGIDGRQEDPSSRMVCVNLDDGKINWAKNNFGYGNTILVGSTILALTENGELVTVQSSPQGYNEISRLQILGKLCWTTPVYAEQRIFLRNDRGDVVCLAP
jgi:outer membrane protein assembly factor BamB